MTVFSAGLRNENSELITSTDLVNSANALMEGIDLDVASSALANKYERFICFRPVVVIFGKRRTKGGK